MLDDYKDGQPIAYKLLKKNISEKKNIHAYLFNTNGYIYAKDFVLAFAKMLICQNNYTNSEKCNNCHICERIDNDNYSEIKIIEPDGLWIKKEQLIDLQQKFSKKAIEGTKKIYIIYEAEKLNTSSANSILKFLEEPAEDIIAILLTNDFHRVLKTIISRCQVIILKPNRITDYNKKYESIENKTLLKLGFYSCKKENELNAFLNDGKKKDHLEYIISFVKQYEKNKINTLLDTKHLWHDYFKEKEDLVFVFDVLTLFYKDIVNYLYSGKVEIFDYYLDEIKEVANSSNIQNIIRKINFIIEAKENIKNNANNNLLLDKLIINMEGGV